MGRGAELRRENPSLDVAYKTRVTPAFTLEDRRRTEAHFTAPGQALFYPVLLPAGKGERLKSCFAGPTHSVLLMGIVLLSSLKKTFY